MALFILIPTVLWALGSNHVIRPKQGIELRPGTTTTNYGGFTVSDGDTSGDFTVTSGNVTVTSGDVTLTAGDITLGGGELTVKELASPPANPAATYKKIYCRDNGKCYQLNSAGSETELGAGGGGGGQYKNFRDDTDPEDATAWTDGSDPTFDNGGSASASFVTISSSLIDTTDTSNYQMTQVSGSLDDWYYKQFSVDEGITAGIKFHYTYSGNDDDLQMEIKCATSGAIIYQENLSASSVSKIYVDTVFIPSGCGNFKAGFSVSVENIGAVFKLNRFQFSNSPFVYKNLTDVSMVRVSDGNGYGLTNTTIRRFNVLEEERGTGVTWVDSSQLGATFTINKAGYCTISYADVFTGAANFGISKNSTQLTTSIQNITANDALVISTADTANFSEAVSTSVWLEAGDVIRAHGDATTGSGSDTRSSFTVTCYSESEHVVTPAKSNIEEFYIDGFDSRDGSNRILFDQAHTSGRYSSTLNKLLTEQTTGYTKITANKRVIVFASSGITASGAVNLDGRLQKVDTDGTTVLENFATTVTLNGYVAHTSISTVLEVGQSLQVISDRAVTDNINTTFKVLAVDFEQTILSAIPKKVNYQGKYGRNADACFLDLATGVDTQWQDITDTDCTVVSEVGDTVRCSLSTNGKIQLNCSLDKGRYEICFEGTMQRYADSGFVGQGLTVGYCDDNGTSCAAPSPQYTIADSFVGVLDDPDGAQPTQVTNGITHCSIVDLNKDADWSFRLLEYTTQDSGTAIARLLGYGQQTHVVGYRIKQVD